MTLKVTFKKIENKEKLKSLIERKTEKLSKYFTKKVNVVWNCIEDTTGHLSEVTLSGFKGPVIKARAVSNDMNKTVDLIISKLEAQLRKRQLVLSTKRYDKNRVMKQLSY